MREKINRVLPKYSGVIMLAFGVIAGFFPDGFLWVQGAKQNLLLGFIIFCMGMSLQESDIRRVLRMPKNIAVGILAQYLIMPLSVLVICQVAKPETGIRVGLVLVACCPGAAASNLMTYLAGGDVAYSIGVTLSTTLLAPIMTPLMTLFCLGESVTVQTVDMVKSIFLIVLIPLALGAVAKRFLGKRKMLAHFQGITPSLSVIGLGFIVAGPIAIYGRAFVGIVAKNFVWAILLNLMGYLGGWYVGRAFRMDTPQKVALSIEVGMQNAGLAIGLAMNFFGGYRQAALIAAFACAFYAIIGSFVAVYFRNRYFGQYQEAAGNIRRLDH